jgi:hypothetical protein
VTTPTEAIAAYRQLQARQAGGTAEEPPVATAPDPNAARKAAEVAAIALLLPVNRQAAQQRAAEAEAERRAGMPPPRETLRTAHQERAEAQAAVDELRQVADRAHTHLTTAIEERDAVRRDLEALEAEHTARLLDELANGSRLRAVSASQ